MQQVNFDSQTLIAAQATLSLFLAAFKSPRYNFELFIFGIIAHELPSSPLPFRLFGAFLGLSLPLDLIWLIRNSHRQGFLIWLLTLINLIMKIPTLLATSATLRERGDDTFSSLPAVNISSRGVSLGPSPSSHQHQSGEPIWSMPGGDLESAAPVQTPATPPAAPAQARNGGGQAGQGRYESI